MSPNRIFPAIAAVVLGLSQSIATAARPCPPDIDCSGAVNVGDLLSVINAWGTSGNPNDVNGDGSVNVLDLLAVINAWGPCLFNYGTVYANAEAQQIGLESLGPAGPLTLPQSLYDRIDRDLGLIRANTPALVTQQHSMAWVPNQLLVSVSNPLNQDYLCLNRFYQVTSIQPLFSTWYTLTFAGKSNIPALAQAYMSSGAVTYAEPNGIFGGENFWTFQNPPGGTWQWNVDDGFWDCFDGCDCHRYYQFDIDLPGTVTPVSYNEAGQPWCDFGSSK